MEVDVPEAASLLVTGGVEAAASVAEVDQRLKRAAARWGQVAQVGVAEVPVREDALVAAGGVLPGQVEALEECAAGKVIDAQISPATVLLNAVLMIEPRVA